MTYHAAVARNVSTTKADRQYCIILIGTVWGEDIVEVRILSNSACARPGLCSSACWRSTLDVKDAQCKSIAEDEV